MTRTFVTGATGFIAAHIIDELLKAGHSVVTSVRSEAKGQNILKNHAQVGKDKLDYVIVEDIAQETAFDEVIKADPPFDTVIHTSSPFHHNFKDPQTEMLDPAIIGTTGILKAIKKSAPTVKRVVVTSSFASIINPFEGNRPGYTYTEADWDPITKEQALSDRANSYRGSKTLAEKAAWDFMEQEKPSFTLATMNPPLVLGPVLPYLQTLDNLNTSNLRIADILTGKAKDEIPATVTFLWVDVRDLALAHVRAAELDEAADKRFLVTAGHFNHVQIADILRDHFPQLKDRLPPPGTKGGEYPAEGMYAADNSRSKKILGIEYRSLTESIVDTAKSLQAIGA